MTRQRIAMRGVWAAPISQPVLNLAIMWRNFSRPLHAVRLFTLQFITGFLEIIENQLNGTSSIALPTRLTNARGALKVDGLDSFNPSSNLKLESDGRSKSKKGKKGGCCK